MGAGTGAPEAKAKAKAKVSLKALKTGGPGPSLAERARARRRRLAAGSAPAPLAPGTGSGPAAAPAPPSVSVPDSDPEEEVEAAADVGGVEVEPTAAAAQRAEAAAAPEPDRIESTPTPPPAPRPGGKAAGGQEAPEAANGAEPGTSGSDSPSEGGDAVQDVLDLFCGGLGEYMEADVPSEGGAPPLEEAGGVPDSSQATQDLHPWETKRREPKKAKRAFPSPPKGKGKKKKGSLKGLLDSQDQDPHNVDWTRSFDAI